VEIKFGENQAAFTLKDEKGFTIFIATKLIEANYPNYRQVIPGEAKERIASCARNSCTPCAAPKS